MILGERTFGKGSVQNLYPFPDDSKLKLTISRYLTPGDRSIQAMGIPADIELVASVVPERDDRLDDSAPIRLFHRERVRREADLDHSLEQGTDRLDDPAYRLRYLSPSGPSEEPPEDFQVSVAREVIEAAKGWRRADVLASAHEVIARRQAEADVALTKAFAAHGIDWSDGPAFQPSARLPLEVAVDLGPTGALTAGEVQQVQVTVTNRSKRTLHRLAAIVVDSDVIEGHEFFFGKLAPGQSRSYAHTVKPQTGWPAEESAYIMDFRDAGERSIGQVDGVLAVAQRELPGFAWSWKVRDLGDGDGIVEVGERVAVDVSVTNVGEGPTVDPFVRLRNRSGKAVDLVVGTLSPGEALDPDGAPCEKREAPESLDCRAVLPPGESFTGTLELEVRGAPPRDTPLEMELSLGDAEAYDHGSVVRAGFYDWYDQKETIRIVVGAQLPQAPVRTPPTVDVTRSPGLRVDRQHTTLSGVVTDDEGVRHVMVFHGDDKVFFEGGGRARDTA